MAGAGQPWYMPLLWPFGHLQSAISRPKDEVAPKPEATADLDLVGHLTSMTAAWRSALIAWVLIYHVSDNYPAFGPAKEWDFGWMWPILLRNVLSGWIICGFWDYILYFSPLKDKLHKFKFNPKYPSASQFKRDAWWTTVSCGTAAMIEIILCHYWATGAIYFQRNMMDTPVSNFLWISLITHWRVPHFWIIHRMMHPWKNKNFPDVGKKLYDWVHSLHHKSYNPTAFSGTNMHPVESTLYFSAALIAVPFGCHPVIVIACIVDCAVGAWLGHDGFQWPGSGDYFHQLHHQHFDCNFGAMHVPIDKWLGTFASSKSDVRQIWADPKDAKKAAQ